MGHNMAGPSSFLAERAGLRRHDLHQGHGGCAVDQEGSERYGMPQVRMSAVSLRRSGVVCRSVVAGTGIWAKSEGLNGVHVAWAVVTASVPTFVLCRGSLV